MHILFYSTNSNHFDGNSQRITSIPSCGQEWDEFFIHRPQVQVTVVSQKPAMFLADLQGDELSSPCGKVNYVFVDPCTSAPDIARIILEQKPDVAVAASFWMRPYDWLMMKDSLVAQELKALGVRTVCHPLESTMNCFDKHCTSFVLDKVGLNKAESVFVDHQLYWVAGNKKECAENVYKECVLSKIRQLHFPVIIKDTVGLSSYGMEVCQTWGETKSYLNSKRNNSDRIVEELIQGQQFGLEIHGRKGNYTVLDPFIFSVNKYGITSPKQSVKLGPVTSPKFRIQELKEQMVSLAEELQLEGVAQVDLVFADDRWYVIEVNPRLSGMSTTYASALGKDFYSMILDAAGVADNSEAISETTTTTANHNPMSYTMNFKLPLLPKETLASLHQLPYIKRIRQIENFAAKQEREKGYCEIILGGAETLQQLMDFLEDFKIKNGELVEEVFYQNAVALSKTIEC